MRDSLERFDDAPADQLLRRLMGVFTPGVVFRDVVMPCLRALGERWECGEATVAQEHVASCFLEHWMLGCARRPRDSANRRAVLAGLPGEQHSLGLTAFGVVLQDSAGASRSSGATSRWERSASRPTRYAPTRSCSPP